MALHTTQCPHCFTTYVISDEQLRVSEGMVRCGSCRERFEARIIDPNKQEAPKFNPKETFIEPLTEEVEAELKLAEKRAEEELKARKLKEIRDKAKREEEARQAQIEKEKNASISKIEPDSIDADFNSNELSVNLLLDNIKAKEKRDNLLAEQNAAFEAAASTADFNQIALEKESQQKQHELENSIELIGYDHDRRLPNGVKTDSKEELDENNINQVDSSETSSNETDSREIGTNKEDLIEQVDSLVEDKLLQPIFNQTSESNGSQDLIAEPFHLDRKQRSTSSTSSKLWSLLLSIPLLLVLLILLFALAYQLWSRQIITFDNKSTLQNSVRNKITELSKPVVEKLSEYNVVLPSRRSLSQLELASARTEAHPSKETTTLLRISIINHANIEQELPWLEMSLTDAEGKLVARRSLSPHDYVYQNTTGHSIGARELKKITIELLSFPKKASGYELKIIDR